MIPLPRNEECPKELNFCEKLYKIIARKGRRKKVRVCIPSRKLWLRLEGQLLQTLVEICGKKTTLIVDGHFTYAPSSYGHQPPACFYTEGMPITLNSIPKSSDSPKPQSQGKSDSNQGQSSPTCVTYAICEEKDAGVSNIDVGKIFDRFDEITINVSMDVEDDYLSHSNLAQLAVVCKTIQEDTIDKDVTIVAKGQERVSANKCFLKVHSPVLRALLEGSFEEAKTSEIKMEYSAESIKSLLDYMYTMNFREAVNCSTLAVELLEVANYYQVKLLEEKLMELFLQKANSWFDGNAAIELFRLATKIEMRLSSELKSKAIHVLKEKGNPRNFENLRKLFATDWDAALELTVMALEN
ncbi:BTB and MATH domain-containing protein 42 [Orchesella cincta]|uniref:BTB and MATH domain-containing protein 42 n=1 Tax=Orchesella cincta TaxID=48709 RepID=A0A1D2M4P6_ORCCI|nr:BTB and MATH domain-containing protein 42 [Orchesella cincta]